MTVGYHVPDLVMAITNLRAALKAIDTIADNAEENEAGQIAALRQVSAIAQFELKHGAPIGDPR